MGSLGSLNRVYSGINWRSSHAKYLWALCWVGQGNVAVFNDPVDESDFVESTHDGVYLPSISVVLLCVMSFIEYKKIDLLHRYERAHQTLIEYLSRADYNHISCENLGPSLLGPEVTAHLSTEMSNLLVKVTFEDSGLLKYQCYAVNLQGGLAMIVRDTLGLA